MDIAGKVLDILFRQTSPERVLRSLVQYVTGEEKAFLKEKSNYDNDNENLFMDFAEAALGGYSVNEQRMLYQQINQKRASWEKQIMLPGGFLGCLIRYGQEVLVTVGGEPRCRSEMALSWRDIYLRIGQDTIVCPYLAHEDYYRRVTRTDFTWPAILKINDNELYHILEKGMAENHNHLNGSTQSFQITWCRIMNYPESIRTELKHFAGSSLHSRMSRGKEGHSLDMYEQLELAALIRTILFRAIHRDEFENKPRTGRDDIDMVSREPFDGEQAFDDEYINVFSVSNQLSALIDCLRLEKGVQLEYPDGESFCLDYMLDNTLLQRCCNSHIRLLVGERFFLYKCTLECLKGDGFSIFEQGLLYLYLILKSNFRSEMIQANGQTGFQNFQNYQDRKDDAWDENPYFWEASRMALNYRLEAEPIIALEGRLVPKAAAEKNIEKVWRFDRAKRFADCPAGVIVDPTEYNFDKELNLEKFVHLPYFYVYHFIKIPDDRKLEENQFREVPCRHQTHRKNLRDAAIGLATALRESAYLRNRVRGIDASSNEVGCRPEVFAPLYRYLDGVEKKWNTRLDDLLSSSPMCISKTYHAGEDFLDIADGLRAIDEAVGFLGLGQGSRIGHALAMGVDPEEHYRLKQYEIVTTKQDRLDDLVWVIYRSRELGVRIEERLDSRLRIEAYRLFRYIYGEAVNDNNWNCGLVDYYHSMKLRSDDPFAYSPFRKLETCSLIDEFDQYCQDNSDSKLVEYRNEKNIAGLYYYYHYGLDEGIRGQERITCKVDQAYLKLMQQIQDAMRRYLYEKKIIIECNPSSNVLIGTFQRYDSHPVFRFYNRKLRRKENSDHTQVQVCVNTDDLGVFDTSLEFEYALLEQTLLAQKDDMGESVYCARDVMEYLDDLRRMGVGAVFPENQKSRVRL